MKRPLRFLLFGVLLVLPAPIDAQTPPKGVGDTPHLKIMSPRDGAVVAPGDTLQVTVSSPDRTRFVGITVVMEDSIETPDQEATTLPARFAIKIPKDTAPDSYSVTAMGARANGELIAAVIFVTIERREMPRAITARVPQLYIDKKGGTREIELIGTFGDGDFVDLRHSSRLTFESSDTAVATVDKAGNITAVGSGRTTIVAWYGPRDKGTKVSIPVEVR